MIYLEYVALAVLVVVFSLRLSYYVDCLDKKSDLSGAFIGGVMLAAVTSLPELFTSLTAILALDQPELVQGNVIGSNLFNLCIIAGLVIWRTKQYQKAYLAKSHKQILYFDLLMGLLVLMGIFFPINISIGFLNLNLVSILIVIVYVINLKLVKNDDEQESGEDNIPFGMKRIITCFIVYSIALIIASILLTQVTNVISTQLNLGATLAGAIFLGIVTSLPELSASLNLVLIGNFNASFGNVTGSCLFNFLILSLGDLMYTKGNIYMNENSTITLIIFALISTLLTLGLISGRNKKGIVLVCSILIIVSYLSSLVLAA